MSDTTYATATVPAGLLPDWPSTLDLDIDPADLPTMTALELDDHARLVKEALSAIQVPQALRCGLDGVNRLIRAEQDYRAGIPTRNPWPILPEWDGDHCPSSCYHCGGQGCTPVAGDR